MNPKPTIEVQYYTDVTRQLAARYNMLGNE